jgi:hypothetical protein
MFKFYFGCLFGGLKGFRENWKSPLEAEKKWREKEILYCRGLNEVYILVRYSIMALF